ncbi:MAG: DMT family transporter [Ignavibacteria bacterium]|nr:DMT family transporter [Ignavibacteria bacterium]
MPPENPVSGNILKAAVAAILGFLFLSLVGVFIKLEESSGASVEWVVFVQYFTSFTISILLASKNKFRDLKTKKLGLHLIRGVTGVLSFTCVVIAISKIPLVNATLLNNTTPLFIPVISFIWIKSIIDKKIWWGIFTGLIGIILILRPSPDQLIKEGDLYGLAAGIFLAIAYVALKILTKTESFITVIFYYSFVSVVISLPFAVNNWSNPPAHIWILGILTGVCFISYLLLLQYAYKLADAIKLSPLNYSIVVFTGIFDWIIFNHVPELLTLLGIVLVSAGGILALRLHEKDNERLKHSVHG